jgi:hypothetical protein
MKKLIKKSPSGLYWDLFVNGRFVERFDRKRDASEAFEVMVKGVLS